MVTKTKEGRGANGGAGRSVTESAAAQAAPATRKKAAGAPLRERQKEARGAASPPPARMSPTHPRARTTRQPTRRAIYQDHPQQP